MDTYDTGWTEQSLQKYIITEIPSIPYEDMMKIRNSFVYDNVDIDTAISRYKLEQRIKHWMQSKNKKYYRILKYNGATKYMYACKEYVEYTCRVHGWTFESVGET